MGRLPLTRSDAEWEELLPTLFTYDPATGVLRWKIRASTRVHVGDVAGACHSGFGYVQLKYQGATILAQRAAHFFMTGKLPKRIKDHRNRIPNDNSWDNLRDADRVLNTANSRKRCDSVSPYKGVTPITRSTRWQASITENKQRHYLGAFDTAEEAHAAYCAAAIAYFGEFACFR